ncbi:MAG: SPOR domain-containing protein [Curvibacter sp.]|nr:SPOR domain-containing protein [Curvibacter sp.]
MALFKFRWPLGGASSKGRDDRPPASSQADSVEVLRRRARHRLIGAAVLVVAGVVGFPLLFDTQPRPIPVDIPIVIPDKNKAASLPVPSSVPSGSETVAASGRPNGIAPDEEVVPEPSTPPARTAQKEEPAPVPAPPKPDAAKKEPVTEARKEPSKPAVPKAPDSQTAARSEPKADARATAKSEARTDARPTAKADDAARARALLEGKSAPDAAARPAAADTGRFIVQVGAFSDVGKAHEARMKLEKAGLKTYTQAVETADGKRIRVRVGPFASRAEADKAAGRIKGLDLPASILTL